MAEELTRALSSIVAEMAEDVVGRLRTPGALREKAEQLHRDERVGEGFDLWADLLARRAAVLWVLKSVYVRMLEDRGLLPRSRLLDPEAQELFGKLAPSLGETEFLEWIYRDLASPEAGLTDLFVPQPAELAHPSSPLSRKLLDLWRHRDPDTGKLDHDLSGERFSGRLMGDLYQDLDPVVKERYALLQTPDFIIDFILDQTLEPAIEHWGVDVVRILDPSCGSGHFLLAAFRRLVERTRSEHPERPVVEVVESCLSRVVGIDLNDYACALARARLVMTALEMMDTDDIGRARDLHPRVFWADGLEQCEREELKQLGLGLEGEEEDKPPALMTRPEVRRALRPLLKQGFHVVVGNPPYITEKDKARKKYHREKVGRRPRYLSAYRTYSLVSPFLERCFQLCIRGGFVGAIVGNSFMKREFGKPLIEQVLAGQDLFEVVDLSGVRVPGHGTPTALIMGQKHPPEGDVIRAVLGKRGDPPAVEAAAEGPTWTAIRDQHLEAGFENDFVSVADVSRERFDKHPWSLGGGGAGELKSKLEMPSQVLAEAVEAIGRTTVVGEDDVYIMGGRDAARLQLSSLAVPLVVGEVVRDWVLDAPPIALYPYESLGGEALPTDHPHLLDHFWNYRSLLSARTVFGKSLEDRGGMFFEHLEHYRDKLRTPLSIAYADVATHNHFVLDRGGKVFNRTAPIIKLPEDATDEDHLALLGLLNSSVACFWMKQVFHNRGTRGEKGGITAENWEQFYARDGTKLKKFPVATKDDATLIDFARRLDALGRERVDDTARAVIDEHAELGPGTLREELTKRQLRDHGRLLQMVGLQEELDWYCYTLYGIEPDDEETLEPAEAPALRPGLRPFEIALARQDAEVRAAIAAGKQPIDQPTAWFERHGWEPVTELDAVEHQTGSREYAELVRARLERTASSRALSLLEQPTHKRRWYRPVYKAQEQEALNEWIDDRIEAWAKTRGEPFTVRLAAAALQDDAALQAVCELLTGRRDFDLERLLGERVRHESVPNIKFHRYKPSGLKKRSVWEQTWADQHREDRGEEVTPAVPPRYKSSDFLRPEIWRHRGKLDVPKERFIALTEVPGAEDEKALYGWAGWTPRDCARVLLELDEALEAEGIELDDRIGMLHGAWFLLPWVEWESTEAAAEFRAIITSLVGRDGVTEEMLARWAKDHPPPTRGRGRRGRRTTRKG